MTGRSFLAAAALAALITAPGPKAAAQQTESRLYDITSSGTLRVCQYPAYYSISFRNLL